MNDLVSIVIPSRNEPYTQKTVEDLLDKATGKIEIYVILDGAWLQKQKYSSDPRVNYVHRSHARGMRNAINTGVTLSRGKYILKSDAHCMFDRGFDEKLKADHKDRFIQIPRRYPLDPEKWAIQKRNDDKYPIDVMRLNDDLQAIPTRERQNNALIETWSFQGSCWFMTKDFYNELELLDEEKYGSFWQEAQEIAFKAQENNGKVIRNTKTWYAHYHKTKGRGYSLKADKEKTRKAIRELHDKK